MDGLGHFGTFYRIALPLARPALGALASFTFLHSSNLHLEPIVCLSSPDMFTQPQALTQLVDAYGRPMWNVQLAAASHDRRADPDRFRPRPAPVHRGTGAHRA